MFAFSTRLASLKVVTKPGEPALYYFLDGPKRGFVREELLVVPPNSQLPPANDAQN